MVTADLPAAPPADRVLSRGADVRSDAVASAGPRVVRDPAGHAATGRIHLRDHEHHHGLELVTALYEFMLTPLFLDTLNGTPLLPWYYRLLGARIRRRVCVHTTGLIEFDLVEVGDRVIVNEDAVLQPHLFEDRVLKASKLRIGADWEVGAGSVILYDTVMESGARLDALSLLMKGETLPPAPRGVAPDERPTGAAPPEF